MSVQPPKGTKAFGGFTQAEGGHFETTTRSSYSRPTSANDQQGSQPSWKETRDKKANAPVKYQRDPVPVTKADQGHYETHNRATFHNVARAPRAPASSDPKNVYSCSKDTSTKADSDHFSSTTKSTHSKDSSSQAGSQTPTTGASQQRRGSNDSQASGDANRGESLRSTNPTGSSAFGTSPAPKPGPYNRPGSQLSPSVSVEAAGARSKLIAKPHLAYDAPSSTAEPGHFSTSQNADFSAKRASGKVGGKGGGVHSPHNPHKTYDHATTPADEGHWTTSTKTQFHNKSCFNSTEMKDRYKYKMNSEPAHHDQYETSHQNHFSPRRSGSPQ